MYIAALNTSGDRIHFLILVVLAVVVGVYLLYLNRKKEPADISPFFITLTKERLDATPDETLVSTVIANLLAKLDKKHPDPYVTIPSLGEARCTVYCVWVYDRLMTEDGAAALRKDQAAMLLNFALEGFKTLEATECAAAIEAVFAAENEEELSAAADAYAAAVAEEQPLSACVPFIRDNLSLFCDEVSHL